jgi:integrase
MLKGDNPTAGIRPFREEKRQRFLNPDEVARLNTALLDELDWRWRAWFPLSLMLGARRGELTGMRWEDIDFDARTWRIPQTKAGRSHLLPLPEPAISILESLPSRESSQWVFPGTGKTGHITEVKSAWQRIRTRGNVADARVHDLRHTLASWLIAAGYNLPLVGRTLNHTQAATTDRYSHLDLTSVRAALETTAALIIRK